MAEGQARGEARGRAEKDVVSRAGAVPMSLADLCCDPSGPRSALTPSLLWCSPPAAVIYGWARPDDLGRITNDRSITLQKK